MTKEDIELIVEWFAHIEQIADDRKTVNGVVMEDWAALDEIKCKAKNCQKYINLHCKQPSIPSNLDEAAEEFSDGEWDGLHDNDGNALYTEDMIQYAFKAGVEWLAGQGWKEVDNQNYPTPDKEKIYVVYTKEHYHLARVINHPNDEDLYQWMCTEFPNHRYDMCEGDRYIEIRKMNTKTETE